MRQLENHMIIGDYADCGLSEEMGCCSGCDALVPADALDKIGTDRYHNHYCPACIADATCSQCKDVTTEPLVNGVCSFCGESEAKKEVRGIMAEYAILGGAA